jgi:hypothetical protein
MKKIILIPAVVIALLFPAKSSAQAQELQQLALNIEKLAQFRAILRDMKKGYEILNGGYNMVKDISEGNFKLHETFLDALLQVSPTVRNYKRVGDIISSQLALVKEYKAAKDSFHNSGLYNESELAYLDNVYENLFKQSLRNLDELAGILTANTMRMSDNERLEAIDRIYDDMQDKLMFLRDFNNDATVLGVQRAREQHDIKAIRILTATSN